MKISRLRPDILFVFLIFIFIEGISFVTYQTAVLGKIDKDNIMSTMKAKIELEEINLSNDEKEVLNLINEYREQNGLSKLKPYSALQEVAKLKADDLVNNKYFSHISPVLGTPFEMLQTNGINYNIAGENLAGNTTPKRAVEAWINSTSHRENILEDRFEYTGIYVIESPVYGKIYVQLFIGIE